LEKLFQKGEDLDWAMAFVVKVVATIPAAMRAEVVRERGNINSVTTINVIHQSIAEEERDDMISVLDHCYSVFGCDLNRIRFEISTVDETTLVADRDDSADIAGKEIVPLWEREEAAV